MAAENPDAVSADYDYGVLRQRFFGDPVRVPALAAVRPVYHSLFADVKLSDALSTSAADAATLTCSSGGGFSYGETAIESVWRLFNRLPLQEYSEGATVVDLGSGIGNVVAAIALLGASGELSGRIARVQGVELLPSLHAIAADAIHKLENLTLPPSLPPNVLSLLSFSDSARHGGHAACLPWEAKVCTDGLLEQHLL